MASIWVYKADGTVQCAPDNQGEISLQEMRKELAAAVGEKNILSQEKRKTGPVITVCGAPTGQVNAYELTQDGFDILMTGYVGSLGFKVWTQAEKPRPFAEGGDGDDFVPWPWAALQRASGTGKDSGTMFVNIAASLTDVSARPMALSELIGRACRCYQEGDLLTMDYWPERVNIELTKDHRIGRIWFG